MIRVIRKRDLRKHYTKHRMTDGRVSQKKQNKSRELHEKKLLQKEEIHARLRKLFETKLSIGGSTAPAIQVANVTDITNTTDVPQ